MTAEGHGLPWWLSGEESAHQCRRHRFNPWTRKMPHPVEQLSPCATATEPTLRNKRAIAMTVTRSSPCHHPPLPQLEKVPGQQRRPSAAKKTKN